MKIASIFFVLLVSSESIESFRQDCPESPINFSSVQSKISSLIDGLAEVYKDFPNHDEFKGNCETLFDTTNKYLNGIKDCESYDVYEFVSSKLKWTKTMKVFCQFDDDIRKGTQNLSFL